MSGDHNQHQADQCEHLWRYIGSKRQAVWQCPYCESLRFVEPPAKDSNEVTTKTVKEIIDGEYCPLPLTIIPNYMGINLVSVKDVSWRKQNDGQLISITVNFNPTLKLFDQSEAKLKEKNDANHV